MLQLEATLIPISVTTDAGEVTAGEGSTQPAVIHTLTTASGPVRVIYPVEFIDEIIQGFKKAKEVAENSSGYTKKPDLYVPGSLNEVNEVAKVHDKIIKDGKIE